MILIRRYYLLIFFIIIISLTSCFNIQENESFSVSVDHLPAGIYEQIIHEESFPIIILLLKVDCGSCVMKWNEANRIIDPLRKHINILSLAHGGQKHIFEIWQENGFRNGKELIWFESELFFADNPKLEVNTSQVLLLNEKLQLIGRSTLDTSSLKNLISIVSEKM